MKFLTASVVASFIVCIIFTIVVLVMGAFDIMVSDTLIQYFFMTFGLELGASAAIKITKHVVKKKELEEKINNIKSNGFDLDKNDLNSSDEDDTFDDDVYYG